MKVADAGQHNFIRAAHDIGDSLRGVIETCKMFPDVFGTVYAGEIIEHVPEPRAALAEWGRVLEPGGTLILTMLARANRKAMPVHPEHVREFSVGQTRAMLAAEGFEVLATDGIYLELLLNWYRPPGLRVDMLTARYGMPEHERLYKPFMRAGHFMPSRAFDLIFVCKKKR